MTTDKPAKPMKTDYVLKDKCMHVSIQRVGLLSFNHPTTVILEFSGVCPNQV
jgi:hypothetical protein